MYPNRATLPCRCASRAALVAAVAALSMAACEGGGAVAPRLGVATVSVSPTPTMMRVADTPDAKPTTSMPSVAVGGSMSSMAEQISAVVRGVFAVRDAAAVGPTFDPDSAALALYASGDALGELRASIADKRDKGVGRRPSVEQLAVVRLGEVFANGSFATALVCQVDDGVLYDVVSGAVVDDSVVTRLAALDFDRSDGVWKVSHVDVIDVWDGVAGCALAPAAYPY